MSTNKWIKMTCVASLLMGNASLVRAEVLSESQDKSLVMMKEVIASKDPKAFHAEIQALAKHLSLQNFEVVSTAQAKHVTSSVAIAKQMAFDCRDTDIRFVKEYSMQTFFSDENSHVIYEVKCNYAIKGSSDRTVTQYKIETDVEGNLTDLSAIYVKSEQPGLVLASNTNIITDNKVTFGQLALGTVGIAVSVMAAGPTGKSLFNGQQDKGKHATMGAIAGALTTSYFLLVKKDSAMKAFLKGVAASVLVGIAKEVRDKMCKCGTVEARDAAATGFGGVVGSLGALSLTIRF